MSHGLPAIAELLVTGCRANGFRALKVLIDSQYKLARTDADTCCNCVLQILSESTPVVSIVFGHHLGVYV